MVTSTKNIGQVAGVFIGNKPPENVTLIWYDNTPSQMRHKIYDPGLSKWVVLDQNVISPITYSELVNLATSVGLSIGEWFLISDRGNVLALAITTTKVQYDDLMGNILIDDLGSNIQYHVTSSNLAIDDVTGVFDEVNKKLVFVFDETVPDFTADDYILGKIKRNNIWSLAKYKLSSFLSTVTGNSISWNGGFFFDFSKALSGQLDKKGGVVSKDTYDLDLQKINTAINNVGKENQQIESNYTEAINEATSNEAIYGKQIPNVETGGEATDIAKGDKLLTIVGKIQKWITKFKFATGIRLSSNFAPYTEVMPPNNNDNVDSALRKIAKYLQGGDNIKVSSGQFPIPTTKPENPVASDSIMQALAKLVYLVNHVDASQLVNNIINFNKIAKAGVLPTDIFRVDLTTSFNFSGGGVGGVMVQGYGNFYFTQTDEYPYSPYRLRLYYNSEFPKILAFAPVIPVIPNVTNQYSNACGLVHYTEGDATLQAIFQIPKATYDTLYNAGNRYFKCVFQADIYNSLTDEQQIFITMNYVNIVNINVRQTALNKGGQQHIIFKLSIIPTVDTNS